MVKHVKEQSNRHLHTLPATLHASKIPNLISPNTMKVILVVIGTFAHRPAVGTRSGILLLWDDDHVDINNIQIGTSLLSSVFMIKSCGTTSGSLLSTTLVSMGKCFLIMRLLLLFLMMTPNVSFLVNSTPFTNKNINIPPMGLFLHTINSCHLEEIKLQNGKFTWSNEKDNPTLVKLDRAFCNVQLGPSL